MPLFGRAVSDTDRAHSVRVVIQVEGYQGGLALIL
jgi:hypothetical protein